MIFSGNEQFYTQGFISKNMDDGFVLFDPENPNWIATDDRGLAIMNMVSEKLTFQEMVYRYSDRFNISNHKSWIHVNSFIRSAIREKFIFSSPTELNCYAGRTNSLKLNKLNELWIHTNNNCNLFCAHCLVDSGPKGDLGMDFDDMKNCIDQAIELGVSRFFITGGEPFIRKDIFDIIDYITGERESGLVILTNGTLLTGENTKKLSKYTNRDLRLQISLDGSTAEINDQVRGKGTFTIIINGIKNCLAAGINPVVTTALTKINHIDVPQITTLLSTLGIKNHHLLWLHPRGRAFSNNENFKLSSDEILEAVRKAKTASAINEIIIDNYDSLGLQVNAEKGVRYDGSNACWDSLCVYSNGDVYPSASLAGISNLNMGNIKKASLKEIWQKSQVSESVRNVSLIKKEGCSDCFVRYICGGGDMESTYITSKKETDKGDFSSIDPYCSLYKGMILDAVQAEIKKSKSLINSKSGFDAPIIYIAKGHNAIQCSSEDKNSENHVETLHSNCVLSVDLDTSRQKVRDYYSKAAADPQEDLCCPTKYDTADTDHIPKEVLDRFYGCGSPMSIAGIKKDEVVVDLGSGAGIDCFIAAKYVGKGGKVIGVDMTDNMLKVANKCKTPVADNLGYDVVEFRKGFLEEIPVEDKSIDLLTSNCVINLSPDKKMVFKGMWRALKDFGRILISDIVSEELVPAYMQANPMLWGECISGALTEDSFISSLEESGFYGISLIKKTFWKEVEGHNFYSITVRGFKYEHTKDSQQKSDIAIYLGPYKSIMDDEGNLFMRNEPVEVCTDTVAKLKQAPYKENFFFVKSEKEVVKDTCDSGSCCC